MFGKVVSRTFSNSIEIVSGSHFVKNNFNSKGRFDTFASYFVPLDLSSFNLSCRMSADVFLKTSSPSCTTEDVV